MFSFQKIDELVSALKKESKADCSDLNIKTPHVLNLDRKNLNKRKRLAIKNQDQDLILACQEALDSLSESQSMSFVIDFVQNIENDLRKDKLVIEDDLIMYRHLVYLLSPTRRTLARSILYSCKRSKSNLLLSTIDHIDDCLERYLSGDEIKLVKSELKTYLENRKS